MTTDASDDGAGAFIHHLWSGINEGERLKVLDLLNELTAPGMQTLGLMMATHRPGTIRPRLLQTLNPFFRLGLRMIRKKHSALRLRVA